MFEFFRKLFDSDFMPHGHCYFWRPEVVWLHVISDGFIALAYYSIPFALWYFMKHRKDLTFNWVYGCFAAFIFACGTTHALQIWTLWHATYRLEGVVKAITGAISMTTALLLIPLVPKAIRIPSSKQFEEANRALAMQVLEREQAEAQIRKLNAGLERRVEERTAALLRSNKELAQFAYIASHDLLEPLRMISSYTQLLKLRYEGRLDADADEYLQFALDGARRMQSLIDDLLSLSRVDHVPPVMTDTSADAALDDALLNLKLSIAENEAIIHRGPLPRIRGERRQLAQVFQNLIANSLKYRGQDRPEIRIAAYPVGKNWVFSVRDNGIGFDPIHSERIFGVFKRLHHQSSVPGTGVGLSISRKIVERHGGRMWCDSREGGGSTFYFSLPVMEQSPPPSIEPSRQI